jgi:hypothetical protein
MTLINHYQAFVVCICTAITGYYKVLGFTNNINSELRTIQ